MEEIRRLLLIIAKKLNKEHKIINDDELNEFTNSLDKLTYDDLGRFACDFLNKALSSRTIYLTSRGVFDDFTKLQEYFLNLSQVNVNHVIKNIDQIISFLKRQDYISFLDGHFDEKFLKNKLPVLNAKIIIPSDEVVKILGEFYMMGALAAESAGELGPDNLPASGLLSFQSGLQVEIGSYEAMSNGNLFVRIFDGVNAVSRAVEIPFNIIRNCYKTREENISVAIPELL